MRTLRAQFAGAAAILEHFTAGDPIHERNASKRVLAEVTNAWPGEARQQWWKWFAEASSSLGLRTKTLDCTIEEAFSLARNHAQLVCFREDAATAPDGEWLAVMATSRRRFQVLLAKDHDVTERMSARALRKALKRFSIDGSVRCVVMQPHAAVSSTHPGKEGQRFSPVERLREFLKPEASDIWIVIVFAFVVSLLMLATPIAVEALVNTVAFGRLVQPILILALMLLTFLGFQGAIRALQTYVVEVIQRRLFARVAGDLAFRLPRTEAEAMDGEYMPEVVNRFFDVVTVQKVTAQLLLDGLGLILSAFIGMAVLGFYHPWLLGFDVFLLAAIAIIIFVLGRGAVSSAVKESKHKYKMAAWLGDIARCPTAFRNDGGAEFALERADRMVHEYLIARRKHFRIIMRQVLFALGLQAVASTVLLGLGGWLVVSGELTLGQLVAAELIVTVIVGAFAKFGKHMESFYDVLASVDKLGVLFDIPMERQDGMLAITLTEPAQLGLEKVSYAWPGQPKAVDCVDARVAKGESVAVLGDAGSGKTTLLEMIYGLRDPTSGHIVVDGFDPRDLRPDVLRTRISMAHGAEVFHATVEENVHLHREGVTATNVRDVLNGIGLLDPILRLTDGCKTMLTSNGSPLSESQCRLLGIARAAIGRPGLLLVDGSLDMLGAHDLERCLKFLLAEDRPWTLIVATSREEIAQQFARTISLNQFESVGAV
ncbi:peptidase domain-containing ABC transporter [Aureliella helgolandensis]|uniref:Alpha-hemolysin translocation ATP-binding protein HlyB n=1 Tax=Aureliella helgolandensis TaxID=2527968 RepID=A0A518G896_9BACT|nr:ABC transporter ATP-binding protein [Aureliella helgolandensis]QDV24810.1 Alpha-hemolysin translocation ATP-binding protein HlyB [Aureliella helgolandensis]